MAAQPSTSQHTFSPADLRQPLAPPSAFLPRLKSQRGNHRQGQLKQRHQAPVVSHCFVYLIHDCPPILPAIPRAHIQTLFFGPLRFRLQWRRPHQNDRASKSSTQLPNYDANRIRKCNGGWKKKIIRNKRDLNSALLLHI